MTTLKCHAHETILAINIVVVLVTIEKQLLICAPHTVLVQPGLTSRAVNTFHPGVSGSRSKVHWHLSISSKAGHMAMINAATRFNLSLLAGNLLHRQPLLKVDHCWPASLLHVQ